MTREKLFSKRILSAVIAAFTAAALSSCASTGAVGNESVAQTSQAADIESAQPTETEAESTASTEAEPAPNGPKSSTAVVYFSATGTTAEIAKMLADETNGDLFEIVPEMLYTDDDLNYNNDDCRANTEQHDDTARPAIANDFSAVSNYDVVFLGYPIWWGTEPRIIQTFLENYDLPGAKVYTFCTSGGSGIETSVSELQSLYPEANIIGGRNLSDASADDIRDWVESLGINMKNSANKLFLTINGTKISAILEDNSSAQALSEKLAEGDITVEAHDYGSFEKVGELGFSLPANDEQITTEAGDIILYQGDKLTVYYDENSWSFTKLGHIENMTQDELKDLLGDGDVDITLSLK